MGIAANCTTVTPSDMSLGPTLTDALPVTRSTYGGNVMTVCGF